MYHDSNTVYMIFKIEQKLNEDKQGIAQLRKECLSPGTNNFSSIIRCIKERIGKRKRWSGQVKVA